RSADLLKLQEDDAHVGRAARPSLAFDARRQALGARWRALLLDQPAEVQARRRGGEDVPRRGPDRDLGAGGFPRQENPPPLRADGPLIAVGAVDVSSNFSTVDLPGRVLPRSEPRPPLA